MDPISQKDRPIGLLLLDSTFPLPAFTLLSPRPEDLQYTHPGRGTVVQTFNGGFVDDFGEGLTDISVSGHTGWAGGSVPGELQFYTLRDLVVLQYHQARKTKADAGQSIDTVKLYWVDTLNLFVYEVYPVSFTSKKNRQRPLLYQYSMRLIGINRLFGLSDLIGAVSGAIGGAVSGAMAAL
ncbi:hypothetical protein [uncultured Thiodictyon sp.]|uniref:hypothetical protein n=1 Tax=uncultured Thiodictyon sp. TaxID=1846217 RepID=UPI0025F76108|nr:hypothetical protein [uncultured Thiodictyon sp.]